MDDETTVDDQLWARLALSLLLVRCSQRVADFQDDHDWVKENCADE